MSRSAKFLGPRPGPTFPLSRSMRVIDGDKFVAVGFFEDDVETGLVGRGLEPWHKVGFGVGIDVVSGIEGLVFKLGSGIRWVLRGMDLGGGILVGLLGLVEGIGSGIRWDWFIGFICEWAIFIWAGWEAAGPWYRVEFSLRSMEVRTKSVSGLKLGPTCLTSVLPTL
ncbi:penicillin-binding protein 1A [Sesbania bispinosa]|nr:penicillin-binding protein 1A [Sesbania bispinosa]